MMGSGVQVCVCVCVCECVVCLGCESICGSSCKRKENDLFERRLELISKYLSFLTVKHIRRRRSASLI